MTSIVHLDIFASRAIQKKAQVHFMSAQYAFVVQFTPDADPANDQCSGRVEHVASGQATHFHLPEELLAFFSRMLADVRASSSDES